MLNVWVRKMSVLTAVCVALGGAVAVAAADEGDQSAKIEQLKKGQEELRTELQGVKSELKEVRGDLKKVLSQLTAMRKNQGKQKKQRKADTTIYDVKIGKSPVRGPKDAPVTIVEFSDFQCPFCVREVPKIEQIMKEFPNEVRFVHKNFPLNFHKNAKGAAAATMLALKKSPEAFWQMHDMIFESPKKLAVADLRKYAEQLGLDLHEFDTVMADAKKMDALLAEDMAEARKCHVRGTPTVLVNGLKLANRRIEGYRERIKAILKKDKGGTAKPAPK